MAIISPWLDRLTSCGIRQEHITENFVSLLHQHKFTPDSFDEESFFGYRVGDSEEQVGIEVAKEYAGLNGLQEFLEEAIDWSKAWKQLYPHEGWMLVQMEQSTWGLFKEKA